MGIFKLDIFAGCSGGKATKLGRKSGSVPESGGSDGRWMVCLFAFQKNGGLIYPFNF